MVWTPNMGVKPALAPFVRQADLCMDGHAHSRLARPRQGSPRIVFRYLVGNRICRLCAAYLCAVWRSWPGTDQPIQGMIPVGEPGAGEKPRESSGTRDLGRGPGAHASTT